MKPKPKRPSALKISLRSKQIQRDLLKHRHELSPDPESYITMEEAAKQVGISLPSYRNAETYGIMGPEVQRKIYAWLRNHKGGQNGN